MELKIELTHNQQWEITKDYLFEVRRDTINELNYKNWDDADDADERNRLSSLLHATNLLLMDGFFGWETSYNAWIKEYEARVNG